MPAKTKAIVDWISVTVKANRMYPSDWYSSYEVRKKGMLGYDIHVVYTDGRIELSNSNRGDMGHHIIYTGECLRKMEEIYGQDAENIISFHHAQGHKFTRIDLAVDVIDGFTAKECIERYENQECISPLKRADKVQSISGKGDTLYIGRRGGDRMVRIYDKSAQTGTEGVWTRLEAEMRAFGAESVAKAIRDAKSPKKAIYAIIKGICDYKEWEEYQNAMGGSSQTLELGRKVTSGTEKWLIQKVAPSLAKFALDHDGFFQKFMDHVIDLMNEFSASNNKT